MNLPPSLTGNLGYLITTVARQYRVMFDREMQPLGLTRSQWWTLAHIYYYGRINQSELAGLLDIDKAAVTRIIARMTEKGWIESDRNPEDARVKEITLAPHIRPLMADITALSEQLIIQSMNSISPQEITAIGTGLAKLSDNLTDMDGHTSHTALALRHRIQTALAQLAAAPDESPPP